MKTLIVILIIASFLQATIIPLDLVLIILICRSFIRADKANLYLAFSFGLFLSILNFTPMGTQSIIFLMLIAIVESLSKSRLSQNALLVVPICFGAIILNLVIISFITHESIQLIPKIYGGFLSLPTLYLIRFWEERFTVKKEIRLRI